MNQPPSAAHRRSVALAAVLYRWLLITYPRSFRQRYGAHMLQVFRDSCREADRADGLRGLLAFWLPTLVDLLKTALAERLTVARSLARPVAIRACGLLTLLCALGVLVLFEAPSLLWELGMPSYSAWQQGQEALVASILLDTLTLSCFLFGLLGVLLFQRTRGGHVIGSLALFGWLLINVGNYLFRWLFLSEEVPQNLLMFSLWLGYGAHLLIAAGLICCGALLYRLHGGAFSSISLLLGLCLLLELVVTVIGQFGFTVPPFFSSLWMISAVLWVALGASLLLAKQAPVGRAQPALGEGDTPGRSSGYAIMRPDDLPGALCAAQPLQ